MSRNRGKIAVIREANSGIGFLTAKPFIGEGVECVYITGRQKAELDAAAASLGSHAVAVAGNVTDPADTDRLSELVKARAGRVDIVFANEGYRRDRRH